MTTPFDRYVDGMHDKFGYFATWMPNEILRLGDVGVLDGKLFRREMSLEDLGIHFDVRTQGRPAHLSHSSGAGVALRAAAGAPATAPGAAGARVDFTDEGAFVFQARHCTVTSIRDRVLLGQDLVRATSKGEWRPRWVIVDTLVKADQATVLVAHSRGAHLELSGRVGLDLESFALGDAAAEVSVVGWSGDVTRVVAQEGLTPMFRLSRVKSGWLRGSPSFEAVKGGDSGEARGLSRRRSALAAVDGSGQDEVLETVAFPSGT